MDAQEVPRTSTRRRRANVAGGRTRKHEVWASEEEEAFLLLQASVARMTVPAFLMDRAMSPVGGESSQERRARLGELLMLRRLLAADSNNLNQLTRRANSGEALADLRAQLQHTLAAVDRVVEQVDSLLRDEGARS